MYQHTSSSYKYVSLDLTQLNQKKKSARQAPLLKGHGYEYGPDFSIESSWAHGRNDGLRDSMLAYTKRMNDIRRIRGINFMKQAEQAGTTPSLWVNTGKGCLHLDMMEDRKYYSPHNRLTRSLGTIKLEPLLGSRRVSGEDELTPNSSLQTHKVEKEVQLDDEALKVKHITVTISIPSPEQPTQSDEDQPAIQLLAQEPIRHKLVPLGSGKARPRKAKRMKISQPSLESIDEDLDETNSHTQEIEDGYSHLLSDVHSSHEHMLEQKRRTVALLKQTNYAQRSHQRSRQIAMTTLAKKKVRKLPPIPTGKPSLRYTNGSSPAKSPYDERIEPSRNAECG